MKAALTEKIACLCLAFAAAGCALAGGRQPLLRHYGLVPTPECADDRGLKVRWVQVDAAFLSRRGSKIGMASREDDGTPVIYLDVPTLERTPPVFQKFVMAHECAHHSLGHTRTGYGGEGDDEQDADCEAQRDMRRKGPFGPAEIDMIEKTSSALYPPAANGGISWSIPDRRAILAACPA